MPQICNVHLLMMCMGQMAMAGTWTVRRSDASAELTLLDHEHLGWWRSDSLQASLFSRWLRGARQCLGHHAEGVHELR